MGESVHLAPTQDRVKCHHPSAREELCTTDLNPGDAGDRLA